MRVIVAGGAGFIGSHLCARLLKEGHSVLCLDNLITGSESNIAELVEYSAFRFEHFDVTEPCIFESDAIFHLASPASPVGYWKYPFETIQVNSTGTLGLLEAAKRDNSRFLMASTSEVYGDPLVHPQTEDYCGNVNTTGPRACYDESKRLGETITAEFHRQFGTDVRIVRIFNTYGPHNQPDDGRMIPNFITQALTGRPLTIHGTGEQTRSICYVDDLVEGLIRAMFLPGTTNQIFNLGNPEEHTVLEWAQLIRSLCNSVAQFEFEPKREDDPERRRPDISRARDVLGWSPSVAPRDGLLRTIHWLQSSLERGYETALFRA